MIPFVKIILLVVKRESKIKTIGTIRVKLTST